MSITVVVEDGTGKTNANSYISVTDADTYHTFRVHVGAWNDATADDKASALTWATRLLDEQVAWKGDRSSTTQALRWPRSNVINRDRDAYVDGHSVPDWLANATAEFARCLLEKDRPKESEQQRITSRSTQSKSVTMGPKDKQFGAIIPPSVFSLIQPYIVTGVSRLVRV